MSGGKTWLRDGYGNAVRVSAVLGFWPAAGAQGNSTTVLTEGGEMDLSLPSARVRELITKAELGEVTGGGE